MPPLPSTLLVDGYGVWFLERATFIISARSRGPLTCVLASGIAEEGLGREMECSPTSWKNSSNFKSGFFIGGLLSEYFFSFFLLDLD